MPRIPFPHQVEGAEYGIRNNGACYWMKMRTGKTFTTLMAVKGAGAFPVLVVCPKSIMPVWREEFLIDGCDPSEIVMVDGSPSVRNKLLSDPKAVMIVNYEMLEPYRVLQRYRWPAIVLDESLKIGNISSKRTQYVLDYIEQKRYPSDQLRFCLSGSPASEDCFQLVPQMFFVHAEFMGYVSWEKYVMENWKYVAQAYKYMPVNGKKHISEIREWNKTHAYHCDLGIGSDTLRRVIRMEPGKEQASLLRAVREEMSYLSEDGTRKEYTPLVRAGFELQICAGLDPFTKKMVDRRKIHQILDWHMDEDREPCLVVTEYRKGIVEAFLEEAGAKKDRKGVPVKVKAMMGGSAGENLKVLRDFQEGKLDMVIGQVEVVKMGLDFSRASTIHYLSNSYSQDDRSQSELRCNNVNKKEPCETVDYILGGCLDGSLVDLLRKKQDLSSSFVQGWYGKEGGLK